jgi:ribonuclease Z
MRIKTILITHLHGDHVFGLPGLLQTMSLSGRKEPLTVYGPQGIKRCVEAFMEVTEGTTVYPLEVIEVSGDEFFPVGDTFVSVFKTKHNTTSVGYRICEQDRPGKLDKEKAISLGISEGPDMSRLKNGITVNGVKPEDVIGPAIKGASISYTGDTEPTQTVIDGAKGSTVLIHESTYMESERNLATEHSHSTCIQAAETAKQCGANFLILTHVSNRYDDLQEVVDSAKTVFPETYAARDMQMYIVKSDSLSLKE